MFTTALHANARPRHSRNLPHIHRVHPVRLVSCVLLLVAGSLLPAPHAVAADPINGEWQLLEPVPPPPGPLPGRTSFVMVLDTSRDQLIVFGGDPGPSNDVWVCALPSGPGWTRLVTAGTPPSPRYGASAVYDPVGDRLIVVGGYDFGWPGDVWELTLAGTPTWTQLSPTGQAPPARQDASAFYDPVGKQMVVFGGASVPSGFMNDAWTLSLNGRGHWSRLNPSGTPPSVRDLMTTVYDSARERMIIFGGWNGTSYLNDTWALDLSRGRPSWSSIPTASAPSSRREGHAVYDAAGDRVVLFGGVGLGPIPPWWYEYLNDTWQLPLGGVPNWSRLAPSGAIPTARGNGRAVLDATRQRMVLVGGYDLNYRGDVGAFSLVGPPAWTQILSDVTTGPGTLDPLRDYAAVYDPDDRSVLMFGGSESYGDVNDTWRLPLDGAKAAWGFLAAPPALPSPRHGHRAVWDPLRHRMLVFGGYSADDYSGYLNETWSLTPLPSPSWRLHAPPGTRPTNRMLCGLGYDPVRDRLIVVGGHGGFTSGNPPYMNDVWSLSLGGSAMQWTQLAVGGTPPSPRWIYGMRYDPPRDRFLFFGGVTELGRPNDVWALNLAGSPFWSLLTPSGIPPSGRSDHAMIYDPVNDRMVVFGGYDGAFRNDVWALNLAGKGSWAQLTPAGGPPPGRNIIDAIYDAAGGRMVVHGGWSGSSVLGDTWALAWGPPAAARRLSPPLPANIAAPEAQLVQLSWSLQGAAEVQASVERRVRDEEWLGLGAASVTAADRVTFEDRSVEPGARYEYRLRVARGGEEAVSAVSRIDIPSGYALDLVGAQPNPAARELWVALALPRDDAARLELLDVSGRMIAARDVGDLGPGRHRVRLGEDVRLAPGVYMIRLASGGRAITRKALIVR